MAKLEMLSWISIVGCEFRVASFGLRVLFPFRLYILNKLVYLGT
jgi:hypothetical protein